MTKLTETYVNRHGKKFELHEFDSSKTYPPSVVKAVQEQNMLFFNAKQDDSREAIRLSEAARNKANTATTEDEHRAEKLRQQKKQEIEQLLKEEAEKQAIRRHQESLQDVSSNVVSIVTGNPIVLLEDFSIRVQQGYTLMQETLNFSPTIYSIQLRKKANERVKQIK